MDYDTAPDFISSGGGENVVNTQNTASGHSPITAKETTGEETVIMVLALAALHVYSPVVFPNLCFSIVSRVRTGPAASIIVLLWYQAKVAGGLDWAAHDRLKLEPARRNGGGFGGVMATASGPSAEEETNVSRRLFTLRLSLTHLRRTSCENIPMIC